MIMTSTKVTVSGGIEENSGIVFEPPIVVVVYDAISENKKCDKKRR